MSFLKSINKTYLFVIIVLVLTSVAGTKLFINMQNSKVGPFFYDLDIFEINIDRNSKLLKLKISLELDKYLEVNNIKKYEPYIRDICLKYFTSLRSDDLSGSNSLYLMREELIFRINKVIQPLVVKNILFGEIIVT